MSAGFDSIPVLDRAGLRRFGLTMAAIVAVLFGGLLPWSFEFPVPAWPFLVAGFLCLWSATVPGTLNLLYRPWMMLGLVLNRVTTPVIMGAVFYLMITPVSLIMTMLRRDPLARHFDPDAESYRRQSRKPERESLERPY